MTPVSLQALIAALMGSAAIFYVATRSARSEIRAPLLAVLGFLVMWMGGKVLVDLATDPGWSRVALQIRFAGGCGLGPSFLLLATHFTRSSLLARNPGLFAAICVPPALAFLALVTNDGHRLFAKSLDPALLLRPPLEWAGPIFWLSLSWQIGVVLAGVGIIARYATSVVSQAQRLHARALVLAALIPIAATLVHDLDLVPFDFDPIPLTSGAAVAAIFAIIIRYRLLDLLPLARRDVIDALSDAVILTDADGVILDLNPAAEQLLDAPAAKLRDQSMARALARLGAADDAATLERSIDEAVRSDATVSIPLHTAAGSDLEIRADTVLDREEQPSGRFAVVRDVTETRRYERMLRESQQRAIVGGMAAGLAHEVNNPLAFVASNLQQIHRVATFEPAELEGFDKSRTTELSELAEVVAETIEGVERIAQIVGRIIRPGSTNGDDMAQLDPASVIRDAVRLVEFDGQYSVRTRTELPDALSSVEGSPERLSQALLNLVLNAQHVAATMCDVAVVVSASEEPSGLSVQVGLRSSAGTALRDPVVAPPSGSNAEAELSAAYEIVREHGGTLETGAGHGALFTLRLPATT